MPRLSISRDLGLLHPTMRTGIEAVLTDCARENLPLRVFEAWRSPERQQYLYAQGRSRPGNIVTYSRAWESYHQYGLAADFAGFLDQGWTWQLPDTTWVRLKDIGRQHGLETIGFEKSHLQFAGATIGKLRDGRFPPDGDTSWEDNLAAAAQGWNGEPPAPPIPDLRSLRPLLASARTLDWASTPMVGSSDWHARYGGQDWRYDSRGVYLRDDPGQPLRQAGPQTCQTILDLYAEPIHAVSVRYQVPPELIVMTIATETSIYRRSDFTGPPTFRWEPGVQVQDVNPPTFGDYSAGPMQTLATTARDLIRKLRPSTDPFGLAPYYDTNPVPAPAANPLYDPATSIDLGTAAIQAHVAATGLDPILVSATYNAGGLHADTANAWHLKSHGNHLDRAARYYGDACFVLSALRGHAGIA